MKRRYLLLLIPVIVAAVEFGPRVVLSPEGRTRTFFSVQRAWGKHWPFETGKYFPEALLSPLKPEAAVWFEMEPHVKMLLDPDDLGPRMILESGGYENGSFAMIRERLSPGATFIDVGANFGIYALRAAAVVGAGGHVIAVEPNPESVRRLEGNIAASGAGAVTVAPVACSNAEGTLELWVAPRENSGETSLAKANASQEGVVSRSYKVRARPLDDIIRESGAARVDAIKIDVEGAEYMVLQGAQQTLERFRPMLLIELVNSQLRAMGTSAEQVKGWLRDHGYREGRHDDLNVEFLPAEKAR